MVKDLGLAVKALNDGKIVIHKTDTCLGMAVDIANKDAVELLYQVKGMSYDKPVSILAADLNMAEEYGGFSEFADRFVKKYIPGAVTIIVPRTEKLPKWVNQGFSNVGIRIPDERFALDMAKKLGRPITTTSCNITGRPVCTNVAEVEKMFEDYIGSGDVVIAFSGESKIDVSTIIKIGQDDVEVIRRGLVKI